MAANLDREILSEFVDGQLDDEARVAVAVHLSNSAEDTTIVEQYRSRDQDMRDAFDPVLREPVPERLLKIVRAKTPGPENQSEAPGYWKRKTQRYWQPWQMAAGAAAVLCLVVGAGALGWVARGQHASEQLNAMLVQQFIRSASDAYVLYDRDTDRGLNAKTKRMKDFVAWLYESFGNDFTPPELQAEGFEFVGGRLLPSTKGPAAQMTYSDQDNRRVTLFFVKSKSSGPVQAAANLIAQTLNGFETFFIQDDSRSIYFWERDPLKYALVSEMERDDLSVLTEGILSRFTTSTKAQ